MEKAQTEQAQNDTTLSSILPRLGARVTLGYSRQLIINPLSPDGVQHQFSPNHIH